MSSSDQQQHTSLAERIVHHPQKFGYLLLAVFLMLNAAVNASSVWTDLQRSATNGNLWWQPIVWEYSSAVSTLLLCPLLFWWFRQQPLRLVKIGRQLAFHLAGSLIFALLHILIMILLRQPVYALAGDSYGFEPLTADFLYEYRKDAWAYLFFLCCYTLARFFYSRLSGEAHPLNAADNNSGAVTADDDTTPEHFLVKKLDREFLLRNSDIEWLEANGNYVNLHSKGRIYPLRATLSATLKQLEPLGFCRSHRSLAVNLRQIDSMQFQSSGDGEITLYSGNTLALSRRYKDNLKQQLTET
ncbi:LytTR family DNA-binding domain-containing protein [Arsukibacterium tuosuense]|uniref:LytTR family DNA-binding domain-containing protein n=1 Tax=Arsukibacterium tuosuense TaxID=1323745 RepID=UPI001FE81349|nr:LytTR family DNA-binding domain-containing protein [Arsukibacterium tuosuense]